MNRVKVWSTLTILFIIRHLTRSWQDLNYKFNITSYPDIKIVSLWVAGIAALISLILISAAIDRDWTRITRAEIPASGHRDLLLENVREGYTLSIFVVIHEGNDLFRSTIIQPDNTTLYEEEYNDRNFDSVDAQISGPHILRISNTANTEALGYLSFKIAPSSWMPIERMFLLFAAVTSLPALISGLVYRQYKIQGRKIRGLSAIFPVTLVLVILNGVNLGWHYYFVEEISHAVIVNNYYHYIAWALVTYVLMVSLREKPLGSVAQT